MMRKTVRWLKLNHFWKRIKYETKRAEPINSPLYVSFNTKLLSTGRLWRVNSEWKTLWFATLPLDTPIVRLAVFAHLRMYKKKNTFFFFYNDIIHSTDTLPVYTKTVEQRFATTYGRSVSITVNAERIYTF